LKAYFNENPKYVITLHELAVKVEQLNKYVKKIVFTICYLYILHKGHVSLRKQAKSFDDELMVGINSDASIKRLKGSERPINSLDDRITVLAGLESVDILMSFEDDTAVKVIKALKPDVFVKGGDHSEGSLPETPIIKQQGGEVRIINFVNDRSTTGIIRKIRASSPKSVK